MYHFKKDKRSQTSVLLIYKALVKLLEDKNFADITITDIQTVSTVGRATFYRHFDNLLDVLVMKCDQEFEKFYSSYVYSLKNQDRFKMEFSHFIRHYLEYWMNNIEIIEILVKINRADIIFQSMRTAAAIPINLLSPNMKIDTSQMDYFIALRCGLLIGLWITWINEGKKKTIEELMAILMASFDPKINSIF